jgi:hypothetical protein
MVDLIASNSVVSGPMSVSLCCVYSYHKSTKWCHMLYLFNPVLAY